MGTINALISFSASTTIRAADVNSNFTEIRDKVNTYAVLTDVARTITAVQTFSATPVFSAGVTVSAGTAAVQALTSTTIVASGAIRSTATGGLAIGSLAGVQRFSYGVDTAGYFNCINESDGNAGLIVSKLRITGPAAPVSASATGSVGEFAWDAAYFYVCTATNTWRRVAHASW